MRARQKGSLFDEDLEVALVEPSLRELRRAYFGMGAMVGATIMLALCGWAFIYFKGCFGC